MIQVEQKELNAPLLISLMGSELESKQVATI